MKLRWYFLLFLLGCVLTTEAQSSSRFSLEAGLAARMTFWHYRGAWKLPASPIINSDAPYAFQRGVNGAGVNVALGYIISKKAGIVVRETSTFRYAFYYFDQDKCQHCIARTFYWDQSLMISKSIFSSNWYVGGGFTMFSIGKELRFYANGANKVLPLHFNSVDAMVGYEIWRLRFEGKFSYVDRGFPGRARRTAEIIGSSIHYKFLRKPKN